MKRSEYEKRLIIQQIDAQRRVARVDWLELRDSFQPWSEILRFAGVFAPLVGPVRSFAKSVRGHGEGRRKRGWLRWSTVIAAAIPLVLVLFGRRD